MKRIRAFLLFVPSLYVEQAPIAHQSNTFYNILIGILLILIGYYSYKKKLSGSAQKQSKRKRRLDTRELTASDRMMDRLPLPEAVYTLRFAQHSPAPTHLI